MATAWHPRSWQNGSLPCALRAALRTLERTLQQVGLPLSDLWEVDRSSGSRSERLAGICELVHEDRLRCKRLAEIN